MTLNNICLALSKVCLCFPVVAFASEIPSEFQDLMQSEHTETRIMINDTDSVILMADLGYDSVKVDENEKDALLRFLSKQYLKSHAIRHVLTDLMEGVSTSELCKGMRENCVISGALQYQYVVIKDKATVRVVIPTSEMAERKSNRHYIDDAVDQNALMMHHQFNANMGSESDINAFYKNKSTLGAFGGYFVSDLNVSNHSASGNNDLYFDQLNYNYAKEDTRFRFGYTSSSVDYYWNSSAILDAHTQIDAVSFDLGSTSDLIFKNRDSDQRLYFSIPSSGRLIVTRRNGEPVLEKNVSAGQNYISYSSLPKGIHVLNIKVVSGDSVIYHEVRKIYNATKYALNSGSFDYQLSAGSMYKQDADEVATDQYDVEEYQYNGFVQASITNRITDPVLIGVDVLNTAEDYYARAAIQIDVDRNLAANALVGTFSDDSSYLQSELTLGKASFTWSKFYDETSPLKYDLSNYLYGFGSFQEFTANYSHQLGSGNFYASYSNYTSERDGTYYEFGDEEVFDDYKSVMAGYTFSSLWHSTIDINTTYSESTDALSGEMNDEWMFGVNFSVPLGTHSSMNYAASTSSNRYQYHRATINHQFETDDNVSLSSEVGFRYSDSEAIPSETIGEATLSAGYHDQHLSGSSYGYLDTEGDYNVFAAFSGSTIVTDDNTYMTDRAADSYLIIENQQLDQKLHSLTDESEFVSVVRIKSNDDPAGQVLVDEDTVIYPFKPYREYKVALDEAASDYHNTGESFAESSSYPGTILKLDVDLHSVKSYLSVFTDIEGNAVDDVKCKGAGCLDVEELSQGVFKFKISQGLPYQLVSRGQRCVIPYSDEYESYNLGTNFCMPQFDLKDGQQIAKGRNNKLYYYVGEFSQPSVIEQYEEQLANQDLVFVKKQVGEHTFVFIETQEQLADNQVQFIDEFSVYALEESDHFPYASVQETTHEMQ
ncbi:CS1-pili formation C-terminal domain-containing protein [Vibrio sp. VPAP30]|uniref:CS1-pili formation C-terminal domain-containing protein n=1 Tax=Vibrio sp. VPAP30 TaxID=1647102 RepID=UPI000659DDAA|nr:CS1-pili formation C-terminal domain-containing protein [Vibrio sp. VPAP30]KLN65056.1 hypothetical protein ZX61_11635 [Vibrio sp. VPAP30]